MDAYLLKILKLLPALTLIFTIWVLCVTLFIDSGNNGFVIFVLMSLEVYSNWIAIYMISYEKICINDMYKSYTGKDNNREHSVVIDFNSVNPHTAQMECSDNYVRRQSCTDGYKNQDISSQNVDIRKIWYCPKCHTNSPFYCHHCPLCNRCIIHRDHHCFFLGACICLKNLSHFIILCLYAGFVSLYVNFRLFPFLCEHFEKQEEGTPTLWYMGVRCFFPVALGKWLSGQEYFLFFSLVLLFDMLVSISVFTVGFGIYHLYLVLTGQIQLRLKGIKQCSRSCYNMKGNYWDLQRNFVSVFGKWGMLNFLFPIVLVKKTLHIKFSLREYKHI